MMFKKAELELVMFEDADIITTSSVEGDKGLGNVDGSKGDGYDHGPGSLHN